MVKECRAIHLTIVSYPSKILRKQIKRQKNSQKAKNNKLLKATKVNSRPNRQVAHPKPLLQKKIQSLQLQKP